ncbi:MAG: hypothetical protein M1838_004211 [Thelocarpon superellum]|nr:MAG: hypothetical protein M1838_004211 [Thelocarpon superellum]
MLFSVTGVLSLSLSLLSLTSHVSSAPALGSPIGTNIAFTSDSSTFVLQAEEVLIRGIMNPTWIEYASQPSPENLIPVGAQYAASRFTLDNGVLKEVSSGAQLVLNQYSASMQSGGGSSGISLDGNGNLVADIGSGRVRWQLCGGGYNAYLAYNQLNCEDVRLKAVYV